MVKVSGKGLGKKKPLFADWSFPLPPEWSDDGSVTLRTLIERIVRNQVDAFQKRQADSRVLRTLSFQQIDAATETGRITMGASEVEPQKVDVDQAIGNAWQAFDDGIYLVVIDDEEQKVLDREVHLSEDSRITFLRLTLLAGG